MTNHDPEQNEALSTTEDAARLYEQALAQFRCYRGDPVATIDAALALQPELTSGWILHGWLHALGTDPAAEAVVRADIARIESLRPDRREQAHLSALAHFIDGRWRLAGRVLEDLSIAWPEDALALQAGHTIDYLRGDSRMLRDRIARALPSWSAARPGYHAVLGMLAFGREECGDYRGAERAGRAALELEPGDAWAQHAVAHVFEMEGRAREGVAWMRDREPHWADDNFLSVHNWWHLAMFHLDLDERDEVLALFDGPIHASRSTLMTDLIDASALLWRVQLLGEDVSARWRTVADCWRAAAEPGLSGFNDFHAMLAWIGDGRQESVQAWIAAQASVGPDETGDRAEVVAKIAAPLLNALSAYRDGRFDLTVEAFRTVRPIAHRFGGSHAQRDLIDLTLIDAALRADDVELARALLHERCMLKPNSAINRRLIARLPART
jgi:hypothetical protein